MDGEGFEPSKAVPTDLQSAPFGHSGTHPRLNLNYHTMSKKKSQVFFLNIVIKIRVWYHRIRENSWKKGKKNDNRRDFAKSKRWSVVD